MSGGRLLRGILPLVLVFAAYAVVLVFVNPFYQYPVGDEPGYMLAAKTLFEEGKFVLRDYMIASLFFQTLWAYPFLWLAGGFSFTALHLATLTLFVSGVIVWYCLLREIGFGRWLSGFGTALLVFNPFALPLSVTFQTDIPALSLILGASYGFAVWLRSGRLGPLLAGSAMATLSILVRQTGLVLPIAALGTALGLRVMGARGLRPRDALIIVVPSAAAVVGLSVWVRSFQVVPLVWQYRTLSMLNVERILREALVDPFYALHYLALFLLPALGALAGSPAVYRRLASDRRSLVAVAAALAIVVAPSAWLALRRETSMPYFPGDDFLLRDFISAPWTLVTAVTAVGGGILLALSWREMAGLAARADARLAAARWRARLGTTALWAAAAVVVIVALFAVRVGQRGLIRVGEHLVALIYQNMGAIGGTHAHPLEHWTVRVPRVYEDVRWAVLLAGIAAAVALLAVGRALRARPAGRPAEPGGEGSRGRLLIYVTGLLFLLTSTITGLEFARHILPLLPAAIVLVLAGLQRLGGSAVVAVVVLAAWALFSTLNGDAVIRFHGAMWRAYQGLRAQGVSPRDIDPGTFTLVIWEVDLDRVRLTGRVSRWWAGSDLYRLVPSYQIAEYQQSLGQSYDVIGAVPFTNYLLPEAPRVLILKKRAP